MLVRQGFEIISIKLTHIQLRRSINLQPSLYLNKIVPSLELDFVILVFGLKMIRECKLQLFFSVLRSHFPELQLNLLLGVCRA